MMLCSLVLILLHQHNSIHHVLHNRGTNTLLIKLWAKCLQIIHTSIPTNWCLLWSSCYKYIVCQQNLTMENALLLHFEAVKQGAPRSELVCLRNLNAPHTLPSEHTAERVEKMLFSSFINFHIFTWILMYMWFATGLASFNAPWPIKSLPQTTVKLLSVTVNPAKQLCCFISWNFSLGKCKVLI